MHSFPDAAAFVLLFLLCWKVAICLVGAASAYLLACRFGWWVKANDPEYLESLLGGLPFALMLLIVAQLK